MKILSGQPTNKILLKNGSVEQLKQQDLSHELEQQKGELREASQILQEIIQNISEREEKMLSTMKSHMIELIFVICEKILRRELHETEDLVNWIEMIFQSASPLLADEKVNVFLSPQDIVKLHPLFSEISSSTFDVKNLNFLADSSLNSGDVRIESRTGILNSSIERHLEMMKRSLIKE